MKGRRCAVHTDVGDVTAGAHQRDRLLECFGDTDCLHGHVGAQAVGQLGDGRRGIPR